jgi:hypothetical protein
MKTKVMNLLCEIATGLIYGFRTSLSIRAKGGIDDFPSHC